MNDNNLIERPTSETIETFSDMLNDLIRRGVRQIMTQAVEAELQDFLAE